MQSASTDKAEKREDQIKAQFKDKKKRDLQTRKTRRKNINVESGAERL